MGKVISSNSHAQFEQVLYNLSVPFKNVLKAGDEYTTIIKNRENSRPGWSSLHFLWHELLQPLRPQCWLYPSSPVRTSDDTLSVRAWQPWPRTKICSDGCMHAHVFLHCLLTSLACSLAFFDILYPGVRCAGKLPLPRCCSYSSV